MIKVDSALSERLRGLEQHLSTENPVLLDVVKTFQKLDQVGYRLHLMSTEDSYATQVPWWPVIALLGTFSAGKSTFINDLVGQPLQKSGNQAIDDKFTVVCYSADPENRVLPGIALDADMRLPFFKISDQIEKVSAGEGRRIDTYLQLKTTRSETVRGKILIDSPGFDADQQRTSTLRITDHIMDLADLVLVFFDARHPEPGAMKDTLEHLVAKTVNRPDSNKFLYVLNQLDTAAREDNPEDVVGAWQRGLASHGLTAGRFYTIFSRNAAQPIENVQMRERFERKRDEDFAEIESRIEQVEVERAYRVVSALEHLAHAISEREVPALKTIIANWRSLTLRIDAAFAIALLLLLGAIQFGLGVDLISLLSPLGLVAGVAVILVALHFFARNIAANRIDAQLEKDESKQRYRPALARNTRFWRSIFLSNPVGWGKSAQRQIKAVLKSGTDFIHRLNDSFADPSGRLSSAAAEGGSSEK